MPLRTVTRRSLRIAALTLALPLAACGSGVSSSSGTVADARTVGGVAARVSSAPESDWPTFGANAAHTGVGPAATGITAADLGRLRVRTVHIAGVADSAAIELARLRIGGRRRDVAYMTTTYGRTIAIDAGTGERLWQFTPASLAALNGSAQVTTATPVADPDRRFIYAASPDGYVHKLSATSGRETRGSGWPARLTFDAHREKLAAALTVSGSSVIAVTGGYIGDAPVYQGHVVTIDRASGRITHVFNSLCSNVHRLIDPPSRCRESDSAIWAREGAVVEPGTGQIFIATGNADFNGRTDWGDSVLELSRSLALLHSWTPADVRALNAHDTDVGSTAPALVTVGGRRLAVQGGKAGRLDLLDLDRLDGTAAGASGRLGGELASAASPGGGEVLTAPAVLRRGPRALVFVADDSGTAAYRVTGGAHPRINVVWHNGNSGTSPVLAGGLLYIYDEQGGHLDVYAPASGRRLTSLPAPSGHWNSPIVAGGRIILPAGSYHQPTGPGEVLIYHLPGR